MATKAEYLDYLVLKNCVNLIEIDKTIRLERVSHNFASIVRSVCNTKRISLGEFHNIPLALYKGKTTHSSALIRNILFHEIDLALLQQILSRFKHFQSLIFIEDHSTVLHTIISTLSAQRCKPADIVCLSLCVSRANKNKHYLKIIDLLSYSLREIKLLFYSVDSIDGTKNSELIFMAISKCKKLKKLSFDRPNIDELNIFVKIYEENGDLRYLSVRQFVDWKYLWSLFSTQKCLRIIKQLRKIDVGELYYSSINESHQKEIVSVMSAMQKRARLESTVWLFLIRKAMRFSKH